MNIQTIKGGTLPEDTSTQVISKEYIRYNAGKYDPWNPVYNDESYATFLEYQALQLFKGAGKHRMQRIQGRISATRS